MSDDGSGGVDPPETTGNGRATEFDIDVVVIAVGAVAVVAAVVVGVGGTDDKNPAGGGEADDRGTEARVLANADTPGVGIGGA